MYPLTPAAISAGGMSGSLPPPTRPPNLEYGGRFRPCPCLISWKKFQSRQAPAAESLPFARLPLGHFQQPRVGAQPPYPLRGL